MKRNEFKMSVSEQPSPLKLFTAALLGTSVLVSPAFAKEGAAPKISLFGSAPTSSPFPSETREDPFYSPYSPFGDGSKAVYNALKGGKEEIAFWNNKLAESA